MMMKLRMMVSRCCCSEEEMILEHWLFLRYYDARSRLVVKSETGNPAEGWDPFVSVCETSDLLGFDALVHGEHKGPLFGAGDDWAIRMAGGAHEDRSLYHLHRVARTIKRDTPIDNAAVPDWELDLADYEDVVLPEYPNTAYGALLATSSQSSRIVMTSWEWKDNIDDHHGSLWLIGDVPTGTPGVNEGVPVTATRSVWHWDGQVTPDMIAAFGGNERAARQHFKNSRDGTVSTPIEVILPAGRVPLASNDGLWVFQHSSDILLTPGGAASSSGSPYWFPELNNVILGKWSTGGGSSLAPQPSAVLNYDSIFISDVTHGNLVPFTSMNYHVPDYVDYMYGVADWTPLCMNASGTHIFMVISLNKESTLPPASQPDNGGLVSVLVLIRVAISNMTVQGHAVLQVGTPFPALTSREVLGQSAGFCGTMKATPADGVMFNRGDFENNGLPSLGLFCFNSSCQSLWQLNHDGSYWTAGGKIYLNGHPDATGGGAGNPIDPLQVIEVNASTGAIVKEYGGSMPNGSIDIESIEGPIHLR